MCLNRRSTFLVSVPFFGCTLQLFSPKSCKRIGDELNETTWRSRQSATNWPAKVVSWWEDSGRGWGLLAVWWILELSFHSRDDSSEYKSAQTQGSRVKQAKPHLFKVSPHQIWLANSYKSPFWWFTKKCNWEQRSGSPRRVELDLFH